MFKAWKTEDRKNVEAKSGDRYPEKMGDSVGRKTDASGSDVDGSPMCICVRLYLYYLWAMRDLCREPQ